MEKVFYNSFNELKHKIKNGKYVLVFTADWCGDCKFIEPVLPEIENTFREYQFINNDTDKNMHIARSLNIFGIPSFVVYDSGKEIDRLVNKDRKTKNEIISFIDQAIER